MEGNWQIKINGETHAVSAHVPNVSFWPQLTVRLNGNLIHKQTVLLFLGELCRFDVLGHQLTIKVSGLGVLGSISLLIDGMDSAQFNGKGDVLASSLDRPNGPVDTSIVETQRVEERLGEEVREIDNSQSAVGVKRTIRVSREWTQTYVLERETSAKLGGELSVQGAWLVDVKASAEGAIRKRYELNVSERRTYSEELSIDVPEKTRVQVILQWKQLWQCGVVVVRNGGSGSELQVPFRVCLGPTFDQRQIDA